MKRKFQTFTRYAIVGLIGFSLCLTPCLAQVRSNQSAKTDSQPAASTASLTDAWCASAASIPFPGKAAYGRINNYTFRVDQSFLTYEPVVVGPRMRKPGLVLELQQGAIPCGTQSYRGITRVAFCAPRVAFKINFWREDLSGLVGKTIVVKAGSPLDVRVGVRANYPMVTVETNVVARQGTPTYDTDKVWPATHKTYLIGANKYGYGMRLTFGKMQNNRLPGYIVLRVADPEHSFVEGYFYATLKEDRASFMRISP